MCPPETTMTRARHVVDRIGVRVVIAMIRDPCVRRARTVEDCAEHEKLFDDWMQLHCTMSQCAMVTDRRSEPAHARHNQSRQKQSPSRKRKQCDPNQRERVDCEEVNKNPSILTFGFPPRKRPWMLFGKCRSTHL